MIWMGRVPNQKRIITHRIACDGNIPYTVRRRDIEAYAARTLNDAGFKMWLYMSANKDGYDYNLSAAAVEKEYGIKVKQYRNGIQNLIDNDFLVAIGDSNDFDFIEYPVMPSRIDGEKENKDNLLREASVDKVVHVLGKDELRPIHTSDGAVVELPIRNILDGLKDALTNKKNESTIKEIREKCDLTEKQKKEIDDTLDFWELDW